MIYILYMAMGAMGNITAMARRWVQRKMTWRFGAAVRQSVLEIPSLRKICRFGVHTDLLVNQMSADRIPLGCFAGFVDYRGLHDSSICVD